MAKPVGGYYIFGGTIYNHANVRVGWFRPPMWRRNPQAQREVVTVPAANLPVVTGEEVTGKRKRDRHRGRK